jgi:hypothetical protein
VTIGQFYDMTTLEAGKNSFYPGDLVKTHMAWCYQCSDIDFVFKLKTKSVNESRGVKRLFFYEDTRIFVVLSYILPTKTAPDYSCVFLLTPDGDFVWSNGKHFEKFS